MIPTISGDGQARPSVWHEVKARTGPTGTKRPCCLVIWAHFPRRFPAYAISRGVHAAVAIGGDRKEAILCMIPANSVREMATSAI